MDKDVCPKYSYKVNKLFHKHIDHVDLELFNIIVWTESNISGFKGAVNTLDNYQCGKCIFSVPNNKTGKWKLYLSSFSEQEIIRIFNMKVFW